MTASETTGGLDSLLPDLEELRRDLHAHPELSMQETRTAGVAARRLADLGYEVTSGVGHTGVVAVLRNGDGPVVLLRADMDGLPVREESGLPYGSTDTGVDPEGNEVPVMHACGHDTHVTCLVGAASLLAGQLSSWNGTLVLVVQPAEETAAGAQAMLDDGFLDRFPRPDVVLGQHVDPRPAGTVGIRPGTVMAAADSMRITLHGRGSHGSQPQSSVDPVVMAASTVLRLQTIVAREVAPSDTAVVTVGSVHTGSKENIIPRDAELKVNVRTFAEPVRARVLASIERIARAESAASGAPADPEFAQIHSFPLTVNDPDATARVTAALTAELGDEAVHQMEPKAGSEDFGKFGTAAGVPSVFWFFGGGDPAAYDVADAAGRLDQDIATNHSPHFAPVMRPTIGVGVRALTAAALDFLH